MKTNHRLQINKPCGESWAAMTEQANGRLCASCCKTVVDLSNFSDAELIKFFQNKTERICGRLRRDQVNRALIVPLPPKQRLGLSKLAASLLLIAGSESLYSENNSEKIVSFSITNSDIQPKTFSQEEIINPIDSTKIIIKGKVVDENSGEPIPYAAVIVKGTKIGANTNVDGEFKIILPKNFKDESVTLILHYIGYERKEFVLQKKNFSSNNKIKLTQDNDMIMGDMQIIEEKE
jgi:hypothetical protein